MFVGAAFTRSSTATTVTGVGAWKPFLTTREPVTTISSRLLAASAGGPSVWEAEVDADVEIESCAEACVVSARRLVPAIRYSALWTCMSLSQKPVSSAGEASAWPHLDMFGRRKLSSNVSAVNNMHMQYVAQFWPFRVIILNNIICENDLRAARFSECSRSRITLLRFDSVIASMLSFRYANKMLKSMRA